MSETEKLQQQIQSKLKTLRDGTFDADLATKSPVDRSLKQTRELKGHFQKVYSICWAGNGKNEIISVSQDGKLIVWNAETEHKTNAISLKSCWVMACNLEQRNNKMVASGGLNNICSVYKLREFEVGVTVRPDIELEGHQGYISSLKFIGEKRIVTSSGDGSCKLWDLDKQECIRYFGEHVPHDVMSVSPSPIDENIFVSGAVDELCKLWDIRVKSNVGEYQAPKQRQSFFFGFDDEPDLEGESSAGKMIYSGHSSDVNTVSFMRNGHTFASGSDDASCRLWDIRCHQQVNLFRNEQIFCGVTSVEHSISGRILFAGYDDKSLQAWDTLQPSESEEIGVDPLYTLSRHSSKVSTVSVHTGGKALATGSWDSLVKIYA